MHHPFIAYSIDYASSTCDTQWVTTEASYTVHITAFEGPMDLLLHLIKRQELDIHKVSLHQVISQYLQTIRQMRRLDINIAAEFLTTASQLILIKSAALLQRQRFTDHFDDNLQDEPSTAEESALLDQLEEYQRWKKAAAALAELERGMANVHPLVPILLPKADSDTIYQCEVTQLSIAFQNLLERLRYSAPGQTLDTIAQETYPLDEQISSIRTLLADGSEHSFESIFPPGASRAQLIATFLAILELMKINALRVTQAHPFAPLSFHAA